MAKKANPQDQLANIQAAQLAAQVANQAAQLEFQKERMRLLELPQMQNQSQQAIDQLAFQKAQQAWLQASQEASLTGTYQGQPTLDWLERQAKLTGVINGQQTLEGKLNDAQIAQMNAAMANQGKQIALDEEKFQDDKSRFGMQFAYTQEQDRIKNGLNEANLTGTYNGQQTLASQLQAANIAAQQAQTAQQQAGVTGYFNGQETLARQQMNQSGQQAILQLLAGLQGNPYKTARVLGNLSGGQADLLAALAGKYQIGGLTGSAQVPGAPQLSDLWNPFGGPTPYAPGGMQAQGAPAGVPAGAVGAEGAGSSVVAGAQPAAAAAAAPAVPGSVGAEGAGAGGFGGSSATGYTISPPGTQAPVGGYNYQATPGGQTQVYPPGNTAPAGETQVSTSVPVDPGTATGMAQAATPGYVAPSQINAENYANLNKSTQDLTWQMYEDQYGFSPGSAQDAFAKSLPRYGGPQKGSVTAGLGF